jgi:hypothetical protein
MKIAANVNNLDTTCDLMHGDDRDPDLILPTHLNHYLRESRRFSINSPHPGPEASSRARPGRDGYSLRRRNDRARLARAVGLLQVWEPPGRYSGERD